MKLNWGHYLVITMTLFIGFILTMVIFVRGDNDDLTEDEYYEKGLNHEAQIAIERNSLSVLGQVSVNYQANQVIVDLPDSIIVSNIRIELMRPNDASLDKDFVFASIENQSRDLDNKLAFGYSLIRGFWKTKIYWNSDGKEFFADKDLFVQ